MTQSKRKMSDICPLCNGEVNSFMLNYTSSIIMCSDVQCPYPFSNNKVDGKFLTNVSDSSESGFAVIDNDIKSVSTSTVESEKIDRSAKRARMSKNPPLSDSSPKDKTDTSHKATVGDLLTLLNVPSTIVAADLPPADEPKNDVLETLETPTLDNTSINEVIDILSTPENDLVSDVLKLPITQENMLDVLNAPLLFDVPEDPPLFDAQFFDLFPPTSTPPANSSNSTQSTKTPQTTTLTAAATKATMPLNLALPTAFVTKKM